MASTTSFASGISLHLPQSVSSNCYNGTTLFARPQLSLSFSRKPISFRALKSLQLKRNGAFSNGFQRLGRSSKGFVVRCDASSGRVCMKKFWFFWVLLSLLNFGFF